MHPDNEQKVFTVVHERVISNFAFSWNFLSFSWKQIKHHRLLFLFLQMEVSTQNLVGGLPQNVNAYLVLKLMEVVFWEIWLGRATLPRQDIFHLFLSFFFLNILNISFHMKQFVTLCYYLHKN